MMRKIAKEAVMTKTEDSAEEMHSVTKEDVERVLAVGNLLLSVLTPGELEALDQALQAQNNSPVEVIVSHRKVRI